ncbi:hypothetical protein CKAH01_19005 [Colletotrichum kahawae]|uniref:Uncharacterized protein n=1 Tax=Colletotrichum kahawae TaxID=34407 RepID=A0AAD9Y1D5_COLKA|nr:hypothetical protein CKAH01_19005 [Colletotrichum kahawae]
MEVSQAKSLLALKASVPSENASPERVRLWLLQLLRHRKVDLVDGPISFVCLWNGAELHSIHPNHVFGFFISKGIAPHKASNLVRDITECLEVWAYSHGNPLPQSGPLADDGGTVKDYRTRRAACRAAGKVWLAESDSCPIPDAETEPDLIDLPLSVDALRSRTVSEDIATARPSNNPSLLLGAALSTVIGFGVLAWWRVRIHS